jgi:hypothetical protein
MKQDALRTGTITGGSIEGVDFPHMLFVLLSSLGSANTILTNREIKVNDILSCNPLQTVRQAGWRALQLVILLGGDMICDTPHLKFLEDFIPKTIELVNDLFRLKKALSGLDEDGSSRYEVIKLHLLSHYPSSIRQVGAPIYSDTAPYEKYHTHMKGMLEVTSQEKDSRAQQLLVLSLATRRGQAMKEYEAMQNPKPKRERYDTILSIMNMYIIHTRQ